MNELVNEGSIHKISPFSTFKCPVCNTYGTVTRDRIKCHGCNGRGFIVIDDRTGFPVDLSDRKIEDDDK